MLFPKFLPEISEIASALPLPWTPPMPAARHPAVPALAPHKVPFEARQLRQMNWIITGVTAFAATVAVLLVAISAVMLAMG
jgi:hypothetical protein